MNGTLYLIPSEMGEQTSERLFPPFNLNTIQSIRYFVVENTRTARRFIKKVCPTIRIEELEFFEINKHAPSEKVAEMMQPLFDGYDMGIISEAGMPCIADPGNLIVAEAHKKNVRVVPLVGPNSIIMALIASGFNGQNFAFHGYVPIKDDRKRMLTTWESVAQRTGQTQIFMETPYRNEQLFVDLLTVLRSTTKLCVATDITLPSEFIKTKTIAEWKKEIPAIQKRPTIFLIF